MNNNERYDRQLRVPGFDADAQQQLLNAEVLLVGAGGLGFAVASQLVGAGVGHIQIVDFDTVSISNLHRQWLYTENEIGLAKAQVLAKHLTALNSQVEISAVVERISKNNAESLVKGKSLIIDAADNFATSYLLSDIAMQHELALISASVNQRYGYVGQFCAGGAPSFRAVFPKVSNTQTSCDLVGVSGPAVTVIAGLQAQAALDCISHSEHSLSAKVLYVDLRQYTFNLLDCCNALEPTNTTIEFIDGTEVCTGDWVIDVREADEIETSPQSFRVDQTSPLSSFNGNDVLAKQEMRIVVACQSGQRAMVAGQQLLNCGRHNVAVVLPSQG